MTRKLTREEREEAFRQAEASLWLEGMNPPKTAEYEEIKARVIAGELTFKQAADLFFAPYRERARKAGTGA